jgi:hypothetical protein
MAIEYDENQFGLITSLLHQAVCEQRLEPDFSEEALGFTGPVERAFATAILEDVLSMRWSLKCPDCQGYDPEDYIVTAEVWAAAGLEPDSGWFHLACLSKRLGRPLIEADFPADIPANDWRPWETRAARQAP